MSETETMDTNQNIFHSDVWHRADGGPRYSQLSAHLAQAINDGLLKQGFRFPAERELALLADVSRVTIRKALNELVDAGLIELKRGSGNFVLGPAPRTEQSLSSLVSFTENLEARGQKSSSQILNRGLFVSSPDEMMALGLSSNQRVARIERLRFADDTPMALEISSVPSDILSDPSKVTTSLYKVLRSKNQVPNRAVQRVIAVSVQAKEAQLLGVPENTALLKITRTAFLISGRPIEYTVGLYRPDIYDFVAEIRPDGGF